jgi:MFS family permease
MRIYIHIIVCPEGNSSRQVNMSASGPTISIQQSPPSAGHPLRLPYFRNLWIGSTVSLLGDQFYLVALPWLVLQLTGSSLVLGTVLTVAAVPRALLMFVGGAVTDRVSARTVLLATAAIRAILVGIVASLIALHVIRFWHLYLLTFAFGVADGFLSARGFRVAADAFATPTTAGGERVHAKL